MKIGFAPSVYEHAAFLIRETPWRVSRDPKLLYQSHRTAHETYQHSPVVVGIDIYNLEAEAYGAQVERPKGAGIPAIKKTLCTSLDAALGIEPFDVRRDGRLMMVIDCGQRLKTDLDGTTIAVPVSGPFSIAANLRGIEGLLCDLALRPDDVSVLLDRLVTAQLMFCGAIVEAGLDIALFESAAAPPLLSPAGFERVELAAMNRLMKSIEREYGRRLPFIIGGDTACILDPIVSTGTSMVICPAETDREEFMRRVSKYPGVTVRVNLGPRLVEQGPVEAILREVDRVLALSRTVENTVLLGTGAVPYATPPEHILAIRDHVDTG